MEPAKTQDAALKQQIVERIRQANNILVTVSANPTVDQLAACIGITLLLNRLDKHATAVFSGNIPSTIEFLKPEATIESNTDSLRDFIISLDKEKADKLRYKVEDQVVRIFITPYKTSLSEKDLVFSQGDFNVEVVLALGIKDRAHIDGAITAHGRILHDATVISLNTGTGQAPQLGQLNWQEPSASSLCELIVTMSEAFGSGLIDAQMATAFLTGIVAETNRFSNQKTTPKVMTISAQLMAAGANQQLIASKLEPQSTPVRKAPANTSGTVKLHPAGKPEATPADTVNIDHSKKTPTAVSNEIHIDAQGNIVTPGLPASPAKLAPVEEPASPAEPPQPPPVEPELPPKQPQPPKTETLPDKEPVNPHALLNPENQAPIMGGNFTSVSEPEWQDPYNSISIDPLSGGPAQPSILDHNQTSATPPATDAARNAVEKAYAAAPYDPSDHPIQALNAAPMEDGESANMKNSGDKTAPPPFPPPLSPVNGVVIPNPPADKAT